MICIGYVRLIYNTHADPIYICQAPDLRNIDGIYHLYYAVSTIGSQDSAIGLATSDSMAAGTWIDHGSTGVATTAANNYNAIDPNLLDDSGTFYLTFGSFWGGIEQVPMNSAADKSTGDPYNLAYQPSDNHAIEGSYLYKNGEYYYLFYSAGVCCDLDQSRPPAGDEYKIKVCRSSSPTGNFVSDRATPFRRVDKLTTSRSTSPELRARMEAAVSSSQVMAKFMHLADSASFSLPSWLRDIIC